MEIVSIFDGCLYSFKTSEGDELSDFLERINDVEWLTNFFQDNIEDLQSAFYGNISIKEAISQTLQEAKKLDEILLQIQAQNEAGEMTDLSSLFKPLINREYKHVDLQKSKAKGSNPRSWLRLYAIKIDGDVFAITGGTIKLTQTMNTKPHTLEELEKLTKCQSFLKNENIFDCDSFYEFLSE